MLLYLDDNRPTPAGWERAYTAEDAKLHLINGDVDHLSLDYDLDMPHCPSCNFACGHREGGCARNCACHSQGKENGLDVVNFMVRTGRWPKQKPAVHSHNLDNALRMKKLIDEHYPRK